MGVEGKTMFEKLTTPFLQKIKRKQINRCYKNTFHKLG